MLIVVLLNSCNNNSSNVPVIGFADAFEDNTIAQAKQGFFDALKKDGYSEEQKTIKVIYRNASRSIGPAQCTRPTHRGHGRV